MHRGRTLAREFETRYRQLQIGIGEYDDGVEQWHRYRGDGHGFQRLVQATQHRLIDGPIILLRDGRVFRALLRVRRGRQAKKIRCAVFARPMQNRCAAENDWRPFRARSPQHRQDTKKHVVADNDIGCELVQRLPQTLILGWDSFNKNALARDAQPLWPRRMLLSSGTSEKRSCGSKSAAGGSGKNPAPQLSIRARKAVPVRKVISWPSASSMRVIASSGLRWPVAGVEANRIFMGSVPLIAVKKPLHPDGRSSKQVEAPIFSLHLDFRTERNGYNGKLSWPCQSEDAGQWDLSQ